MIVLQRLLTACQQNTNKNTLFQLLSEASIVDLVSTIRLCFYTRDISYGLGKRKMGRWCFEWIALYHPTLFIRLISYIPYYGRWDDLLYIDHQSFEPLIFQFIQMQLEIDMWNMMIGLHATFCAKWLPSEGKSFHKSYPDKFQRLLSALHLTPKEYRQRLNVLRQYTKVPEQLICKKNWKNIDYNLMSKHALHKHTKTFLKFDSLRFNECHHTKPQQLRLRLKRLVDIIDSSRYTFINQIFESLTI